jgi:hypothetical protein
MPRQTNKPDAGKNFFETAIISDTGNAGEYHSLNFNDGSVLYFTTPIKQDFTSILIDNIGTGKIKICFNFPNVVPDATSTWAKTLESKDSIFIENDTYHLGIFYITSSTVEIVLKSI